MIKKLTTTIRVYVNRLELVPISSMEEIIEDIIIYDGTDYEIMDGIEYLRNFADESSEFCFTKAFNSQKIVEQWQRGNQQ